MLHVITWFILTPKAMDVRARRPAGAGVAGVASQYVGLGGGVGVRLLAGDPMTSDASSRRLADVQRRWSDGRGVPAESWCSCSALAFPLGWVCDGPTTTICVAVLGNPLTILVLLGMFV